MGCQRKSWRRSSEKSDGEAAGCLAAFIWSRPGSTRPAGASGGLAVAGTGPGAILAFLKSISMLIMGCPPLIRRDASRAACYPPDGMTYRQAPGMSLSESGKKSVSGAQVPGSLRRLRGNLPSPACRWLSFRVATGPRAAAAWRGRARSPCRGSRSATRRSP